MRHRSFGLCTAAALAAGALIWAQTGSALGESERVIFTADFEKPRDTVGWGYQGDFELRDERPPGGGIYLPITGEEWQEHQSEDTLFCAAGGPAPRPGRVRPPAPAPKSPNSSAPTSR